MAARGGHLQSAELPYLKLIKLKFNLLSEIMDNTSGECRRTLKRNKQIPDEI